jgi:hypothetical protein
MFSESMRIQPHFDTLRFNTGTGVLIQSRRRKLISYFKETSKEDVKFLKILDSGKS